MHRLWQGLVQAANIYKTTLGRRQVRIPFQPRKVLADSVQLLNSVLLLEKNIFYFLQVHASRSFHCSALWSCCPAAKLTMELFCWV